MSSDASRASLDAKLRDRSLAVEPGSHVRTQGRAGVHLVVEVHDRTRGVIVACRAGRRPLAAGTVRAVGRPLDCSDCEAHRAI